MPKAQAPYARLKETFLAKRCLQHSLGISQWQQLITEVAEITATRQKTRKSLLVFFSLSIILTSIGVLIGLVNEVTPTILFALLSIAGASLLGLLVALKRYPKTNSGFLHSAVLPLLSCLQQDCDPIAIVSMSLDISSPTAENKRCHPPGTPTSLKPGKLTFFNNTFFSGSTKLLDNCHLSWLISDRITKRVITKRSASGKYKTKTKFKTKRLFEVTISAPQKNFQFNSRYVKPDSFKVRISNSKNRFKIKVSAYHKFSENDPTPAINTLLQLVLTAYNHLQPVISKEEEVSNAQVQC